MNRVKWFQLLLSKNIFIFNINHLFTQSNKYHYVTLINLFNTIHSFTHSPMLPSIAMYHEQFNSTSFIYLHTFKWSNCSNFKNFIKRKSFFMIHFNCQTVLFDPSIGSYQVLPLQVRVDLVEMEMKGYSIFPKSSSDNLMLYPGYSLGVDRPTPQQICSQCILQLQPTGLR